MKEGMGLKERSGGAGDETDRQSIIPDADRKTEMEFCAYNGDHGCIGGGCSITSCLYRIADRYSAQT